MAKFSVDKGRYNYKVLISIEDAAPMSPPLRPLKEWKPRSAAADDMQCQPVIAVHSVCVGHLCAESFPNPDHAPPSRHTQLAD